ncbi:MAG: hypothetical protein J5647_13820 [Spirochaetaceae bacterium]|nr:hypothetical protein [Spirochaetaceae bacterium]
MANMIFAQAYNDDISDDMNDDFFEFIVVEEPVSEDETEVVSESEAVSTEEVVSPEDYAEIEETQELPSEEQKNLGESSEQEDILPQSDVVAENPVEEIIPAESSVTEPVSAVASPSAVTSVDVAIETPVNENLVSENSVSSNPVLEEETDETSVENSSIEEEEFTEEAPVDEKTPSRTVTMKKKQYLDVTYPGEGWLYMGDENNSKALSFKGREQKGNTTLLKFYSDRAGEALLHFCKQDILTDTYIHDYLLVTIEKTSGNKQHIQAPEYVPPATVSHESEVDENVASSENLFTGISDTETEISQEESAEEIGEPTVEDVISSGVSLADEPDVIFSFGDGIDFFGDSSDDDEYYQQLIDEANDAFFAGRGQEAIDKAQIVIDDGSYFSDEAYYIQAQVYETNSDMLDVNKAYGLYKTIVDYYPESAYWTKASKRVTYLDRYYFQIR